MPTLTTQTFEQRARRTAALIVGLSLSPSLLVRKHLQALFRYLVLPIVLSSSQWLVYLTEMGIVEFVSMIDTLYLVRALMHLTSQAFSFVISQRKPNPHR